MMRMDPLMRLRTVRQAAGLAVTFTAFTAFYTPSGYAQVPQQRPTGSVVTVQQPISLERGWIGVGVDLSLTGPSTRPSDFVVRVVRTVDGGPAAAVGIVPGDIIRAIDGEPLTVARWQSFAQNLRSGVELRLAVDRAGRSRDVRLTTAPRPNLPPAPMELTAHLDSVRRSFRIQLDAGAGVWASRDYVTLLMTGDSVEEGSARILDRARRNAETYVSRPGSNVDIIAPVEQAANRYSVVWNTDGALPFEYLMLQSSEADSVKSAMVRLRGELSVVAEATQVRQQEIRAIVELTTRRLGDGDVQLLRLRSDNERVQENLERLAIRLAEIGSNERDIRMGATRNPPEFARSPRSVTARVSGRNFVCGAQLNDLNPQLGTYFGSDHGVLVIQVLSGTPCDEAGLVPGDVVTHVGDAEIDSVEGFRRVLDRVFDGGRRAQLMLVRKGELVAATLSR